MSLKQMIDAAEARANAQRERKPGWSCTQDREPQEEAEAARKGLSDGTDSRLLSPQKCPLPRQRPSSPGSAIISTLGTLGIEISKLSVAERRSQKEPWGWPVHHRPNFNCTHPSVYMVPYGYCK